jgi:hypothetical protein
MKGRDILIGAVLGALVVIWATNHHGAPKTPSSQGKHSVSVQSSSHPPGTRSPGVHPSKPAVTSHPPSHPATHPATHPAAAHRTSPAPKNPATAPSHGAASHTTGTHPASSPHTLTKGGSHGSGTFDVSAGLIAIASLIAIAASLSTVTMTMRSLRAAK